MSTFGNWLITLCNSDQTSELIFPVSCKLNGGFTISALNYQKHSYTAVLTKYAKIYKFISTRSETDLLHNAQCNLY